MKLEMSDTEITIVVLFPKTTDWKCSLVAESKFLTPALDKVFRAAYVLFNQNSYLSRILVNC